MASTTTVVTTDDLDGTPGAVTVVFAFEGVTFEIDLTEEHRAEMIEALSVYFDKARRVRGAIVHAHKRAPDKAARGFDIDQLRGWASAHDVPVPQRGRIPQSVVAQYVAFRDAPPSSNGKAKSKTPASG